MSIVFYQEEQDTRIPVLLINKCNLYTFKAHSIDFKITTFASQKQWELYRCFKDICCII